MTLTLMPTVMKYPPQMKVTSSHIKVSACSSYKVAAAVIVSHSKALSKGWGHSRGPRGSMPPGGIRAIKG